MCTLVATSMILHSLCPPSHMTLPNNQSLFKKSDKALSVIVEASNYPNAPTWTCSGDLRVGFQLSGFHTWSLFYLSSNVCWIVICPILKCLTTHPSYHQFSFLVPSQRRLKASHHKGGSLEATLLRVLHSCLMSRYWWEGWCLKLTTFTFKPCHIICQQD